MDGLGAQRGLAPAAPAADRDRYAELLGIPKVVVLGRRLGEGQVELRTRATGETATVPYADLGALLFAPNSN